MGGDVWDYIAPIAGSVLGSVLLPGVGTALGAEIGTAAGAAIGTGVGSALNTGIKTGDPLAALESGALSGAGSYAGNFLGAEAGDLFGGALNQTPAEALSLNPTNVISDVLNQSTIGALGGSAIGSYAANNVIGQDMLGLDFNAKAPTPAQWSPTRAATSAVPTSLAGLGSLSAGQQASNIATQGVYGQGVGQDENQYFLNLMNNKLMDNETVNPVENSYLAQLGLGGYGNNQDLLKAIENYSQV